MAETGIPMRYTGDVATPRFTPHVMPSGKRYQYSAGATVQADPRDVDVLKRLQFEEAPKMDDQQQNIPDSAFEVETNKESIETEQEAQRRLAEGIVPSEDLSTEQSESQDDGVEDGSDDSETELSDEPTPASRRGRPRKNDA